MCTDPHNLWLMAYRPGADFENLNSIRPFNGLALNKLIPTCHEQKLVKRMVVQNRLNPLYGCLEPTKFVFEPNWADNYFSSIIVKKKVPTTMVVKLTTPSNISWYIMFERTYAISYCDVAHIRLVVDLIVGES